MKSFFLNSAKLLLALLLCSITAQAQQPDNKVKKEEYLSIYRRALNYSDFSSAAMAITGYLEFGGDSTYNDTLALVYYNMNNLNGAYKLAGEINKTDAKNLTALTLLADISGRAGEVKTSLEWYEKLCALNPGAFNHYQLATKQFILERNLECKQSLQKVIADSADAMQQKVRLDVGEGYGEDVPVLAAAMNMLGAIAFKEKNTKLAEEWYGKAVAAYPEFIIAKQNLEELKKPATPTKPTTTKPPVKKG